MNKCSIILIVIFYLICAFSYIKCGTYFNVTLTADKNSFVVNDSTTIECKYPKDVKDTQNVTFDKVELKSTIKTTTKTIVKQTQQDVTDKKNISFTTPDGFNSIKDGKVDLNEGLVSVTLVTADFTDDVEYGCEVSYSVNKIAQNPEAPKLLVPHFAGKLDNVAINVHLKDAKDPKNTKEFKKGETIIIGCKGNYDKLVYEMNIFHDDTLIATSSNRSGNATSHTNPFKSVKKDDITFVKDSNNDIQLANAVEDMVGNYKCQYKALFKRGEKEYYYSKEDSFKVDKVNGAGALLNISYSMVALILISSINSILKK